MSAWDAISFWGPLSPSRRASEFTRIHCGIGRHHDGLRPSRMQKFFSSSDCMLPRRLPHCKRWPANLYQQGYGRNGGFRIPEPPYSQESWKWIDGAVAKCVKTCLISLEFLQNSFIFSCFWHRFHEKLDVKLPQLNILMEIWGRRLSPHKPPSNLH